MKQNESSPKSTLDNQEATLSNEMKQSESSPESTPGTQEAPGQFP